ncbi:hypothetical protein K443DRAFT_8698 [Laccaria amethystina LaAM-08-1]|uniref:Uncharacterized protein n=1 Tax=Laccaria amethystina LaAM-08-1 TaxID=1095629 RepID=A0A0C9XNC6_9AGAR|nr:hypothetical protein K443DRAFT_8698 [Laccaria amethystina LaAM-08-1]
MVSASGAWMRGRRGVIAEGLSLRDYRRGVVCVTGWFVTGAGRTVGEDIETTWAGTNPLAPSVREMGPAARHDTLNDHWNRWNFRKIAGFRILFLKRLKEVFKMSAKQTDVFDKLSATFAPETVKKWEAMVVAWNANPMAPNPYKEPKSGTTLQDVRLQLAREEAAQVATGNAPRHKISLPAFLIIGFELEETQYLIRREVAQTKGLRTSKQLADLQDKRNGLLCQIQNWRDVQLVYTPHVASLLSQSPSPPDTDSHSPSSPPETLPENIPLYMPYSLPPHICTLPELREICQLQRRLREPQADDALSEVRRQRRVTQGLWQFKCFNVSGTGNKPNTRMISLYKCFDKKMMQAAEKYRVVWQALRVLDPNGAWSLHLKELKDADISGPGKDPDDRSTTNSRYVPSWIWLVPRVADASNVEEEFNDSMRVEWAKAKARMIRWEEELLLVQEEMRRVIAYHEWREGCGLSGYAHKQAAICSRMAEQCAIYWFRDLKEKEITPLWATAYKSVLSQLLHQRAAAQVDEECEETALNNNEGNEGDEDQSGDEDEVDSNVEEDDYDDFDFDD